MDLATFGIVIDPRQAKDGGDQTKAVLKSIEVTAKETQAGVVAAFADAANKRTILVRDGQTASATAEKQATSVTAEEALKRVRISADELTKRTANTQARLAAAQAMMDAEAAAEMSAAQRASQAAIAAANATKESTLAAIAAAREGRLQEAREAMDEAASSSAAMRAALAEQAAASRALTATQRELLQQRAGDSKAAAAEAMAAEKAAAAEITEAEKAAQVAIRAELKATAAAAKQAAAERAAAEKKVAEEVKAAAQAAARAESGWAKLERSGVQALAMMGLVAPQANTALIGMQALQTGIELTGAGFLVLSGIVGGFIVVAAGLVGVIALIKGLSDAAHLEPLEQQLGNAVKGFEKLEERMQMLQAFQRQGSGLWKLDAIILANRDLELFSKGALAGADGMKMVGDAAVVAGKPIETVADAIGKLYGAIQNREPIDRFVKQMMSLRLIGPSEAAAISNVKENGGSPADVWAAAEKALKSYSGAMDQYGKTTEGILGRIKVDIDQMLIGIAKPLLPILEPALSALEERLAGITPKAEAAGRMIAGAIAHSDWDQVWEYVSLRAELAFEKVWQAAAGSFRNMLSNALNSVWDDIKNRFTTLPGILNTALPFMHLGDIYSAGKGVATAVSGPSSSSIDRLTAKLAEIEQKWTTSATDADLARWSAAGRPGTPGAGEGELEKLRTDTKVMADFVEQLKLLNDKLSKGTMGQGEFDYRRGQLQQQAIGQLGDPKRANDIYSNPSAADKTWQDILGKWRVFNEQKARAAELADQRIKAGDATWEEALVAGLRKVADQWGNLQQHISNGVGQIANSISNNLTTALTALITGAKDAKTAFRDMTAAILNDIVRVCIQLLVELAIRQAIRALGYSTGGSVGSVGQVGAPGSMDSQALAFDGGQVSDESTVPAAGATSTGTLGGGSISPAVEPPLPSGGINFNDPLVGLPPDPGGSPEPSFANGGTVFGGSGGIDDIPANLTRGEYVIPKDAADHYGTHFLDGVRDKTVKVRGFAAGGPVPGPVTAAGRGGAAGGGDNFSISIALDASGNSTGGKKGGKDDDAEKMKQLAQMIVTGARNTIVREKRAGGLLNNSSPSR